MAIGIVCVLYVLFRIALDFFIVVIGNLIVNNVNTKEVSNACEKVKVMSEKEKYYYDKYGF